MTARRLWYPLAALLGLVTLCVALLSGLCATQAGSRWLLHQVEQQLPGQIAIGRIEGTLLRGLQLSGIDYALEGDRLQIGHLEVRWELAALVYGTLRVERLLIEDARYATPASEADTAFTLPERLALPLAIVLEEGRISGLQIEIGAERLQFDAIEVAARAGPLTGLTLERLQVRVQDHVLDLSGAAALGQPYAFRAEVTWSGRLPDNVPIRGQGKLEGDLRTMTLNHQLEAPALVVTQGTLQFDGATPVLALAGNWQALQWPLTGTADYSSREGDYDLQGTLDAYRFTLSGDLAGVGLPALMVQAQGRGNRQQLELEPLTLATLDGRLVASGTAAWSPQPALELQLQASDLNPGMHWPEWPARLSGAGRLHVAISGEVPRLALEDIDLHGQLRGYPLQVSGGMALAGERFSATDLRVRSGANRLTFSGALDSTAGLDVRIAAPQLAALWPGLGGRLEAEGRVQGTFAQPAGNGQLSARGLSYREYAADAVTATFRLDTQRAADSTAELHATGVHIAAAPAADLTLRARGWLERHRLEFEATTGQGSAQLELAGRYRAERWEGALALATFDLRSLGEWRLREPVTVRASATALEPLHGCWAAGSAAACVHGEWSAARGWRAGADLAAVPLQPLEAFWSVPVAVQGLLEAELSATGSAQGLEARLEARTGPGDITLSPPQQPAYQSRYREARLTARYADETLRLEAAASLEEGTLQGRFTLAGLDGAASPAIDGMADADFPDIGFIDALFPDIEVTGGAVRLQARAGGRLAAPRVSGSAVLEGGSAHLPGPGLTLEDIRLQAEGRNTRVSLNGALRSGKGELGVSGAVELDPGAAWPFDLALQGEDLTVVQLPDIEISASPDLTLRGSTKQIDVSGRVTIPRARIRVRKLPADVVQVSTDQVIVGAEPMANGPPRIPVKVNVRVTLGEDVRFEGLGLTTGLGGEVNIRSSQGAALIGNGILVSEQGRYEGYGQQLDIEHGRLLFAGPLDNPDLDIHATRTVGQVVAGIELSGTLDTPETRLFSDPAMPDAEILSYIVTGKPLSSASGGSDSQALAAAAASLGANSPVGKEISATLGVDIGTRAGATDAETMVTVGKQVTPRLYVDYLYGLFTEVATLQFVYQLTDHFSLLGESGAEQAIDLRFSIDRD